MSNLIKKMAIILLSAIIFGALFYFIFFKSYTSEDTEGQGIFGAIGQKAEDLTISSGDKPDVSFNTELSYIYKFNGHRIYNDSITDIRDLFTIQEENSTDFVDGPLATTFFINILDVKNKDGQSVLTMVDDFNNASNGLFEYCDATKQFRCVTKGTYYVNAELWDSKGHFKKVTLTILVISPEVTYR